MANVGASITQELSEQHAQNEPIAKDGETDKVEPWTTKDPYRCLPKEGNITPRESWALCAELGRQRTKETCQTIRDKVDKILLFASLFSAVITAFVLDSYKRLEVDHQESTANLLFRIHHQLDRVIHEDTSAPLLPLNPDPQLAFEVPSYAVVVNALFLLSLIFSLLVVILGLICFQRVNDYQQEDNVTPVETVELRYLREASTRPTLELLFQYLPVILLYSLFFFLVGLEVLLSKVNRTLMIVASVPVATTLGYILWYSLHEFTLMTRARQTRMTLATGIPPFWALFLPKRIDRENAAELGSLWIARTFPHDIRVIYAFLQSVTSVAPVRRRALLEELYGRDQEHLWEYLDMDGSAPSSIGLHRDVFAAYVLDRFALYLPGLGTDLIGHRFELLLRTFNTAATSYPSFNKVCGAQARSFSTTFFQDGDGLGLVENISTECRIQYCETVWMCMQNDLVEVPCLGCKLDIDVFAKLLVPSFSTSDECLWHMNADILQHVCALNKRVEQYVAPSSPRASLDPASASVDRRIGKAVDYVARVLEVIFLQSQNELTKEEIEVYKTMHPAYMSSITSLVDTLLQYKASVGVSDKSSELDSWKELSRYCEVQGAGPFEESSSTKTKKWSSSGRGGDTVITIPESTRDT